VFRVIFSRKLGFLSDFESKIGVFEPRIGVFEVKLGVLGGFESKMGFLRDF
jgi:hypothetical protein